MRREKEFTRRLVDRQARSCGLGGMGSVLAARGVSSTGNVYIAHATRRINRVKTPVCWAIASLSMVVCTGCQQLGSLLYFSGAAPAQKVPAEFKLPSGPVLILVDDVQDLVQPALTRELLVDSLAKQLKEHKLADHVTTNEELSRVRQADVKFDQRGVRELGRQVGADTVLWIDVRQFSLDKDIELSVIPAQFGVTLKVVNAKADKREDVRLWPLDREGQLVEVSIAAQDVHKLKVPRAICQKLADDMADKIAKLFYEYSVDE